MAMVFKGDPIISKVVSREDGKEESQFCSKLLFDTKAYGLWYGFFFFREIIADPEIICKSWFHDFFSVHSVGKWTTQYSVEKREILSQWKKILEINYLVISLV